ncbi:hypothetical protein HPB48_023181 [Haemaphysalis longicornis]|uniref:Uncharacterized protein n=1 Tax=Haemaphysalis longicornis TaxID=44386 RepID=A0A9J6H6J2_HAELO|nr:hypothetical protein HPB48_023181 [Haemaphysalis longicornis]
MDARALFSLRDADAFAETMGTVMAVFSIAKRRNGPLNVYGNTMYRPWAAVVENTIYHSFYPFPCSSAICTYLCNKFAPASSLNPSCPKSRALVDQVLATITSTIQPHYFTFFVSDFISEHMKLLHA